MSADAHAEVDELQTALRAAQEAVASAASKSDAAGEEAKAAAEDLKASLLAAESAAAAATAEAATAQAALAVAEAAAETAAAETKAALAAAELRSVADSGGGEDAGRIDELASEAEDAHAAREEAEHQAKRYRRELRTASDEVERLQAALAEAEKGGGAGPAGGPDLSAINEVVAELYGAVSSFRPELRTFSEGVELAASEDAEDRGEGVGMLRDTLDTVNSRAKDLKTLTADLKRLLS